VKIPRIVDGHQRLQQRQHAPGGAALRVPEPTFRNLRRAALHADQLTLRARELPHGQVFGCEQQPAENGFASLVLGRAYPVFAAQAGIQAVMAAQIGETDRLPGLQGIEGYDGAKRIDTEFRPAAEAAGKLEFAAGSL